ncbi:uracil-DNA glycosylase [soil metagenome]
MSEQLHLAPPPIWQSLEAVESSARACVDCGLCQTRTNVVFASGNPQAKLMIIAEAPGRNEDEAGVPFVGRAGKLFDKILEAGRIDREKEIYLCNVIKCRPPNNRLPAKNEIQACRKYLDAQLELVRPALILLAGATAVEAILQVKDPISRIRGTWFDWQFGARVMPVFHPTYLLRNDSKEIGSPKWLMWKDIQEVRKQLDNYS